LRRRFKGRHTRAYLLIHAGHGLAYVADQLGHADVQITARHYVHLIEEARQAGSVPMDNAIERTQIEVHGATTTARPEGLGLVQEDTPDDLTTNRRPTGNGAHPYTTDHEGPLSERDSGGAAPP
jgi:hypothetical protein